MIFLVLIMLVDIITRRAAESAPVMEVTETDALERDIARLEEKSRRLLSEIKALRIAANSDASVEERKAAEEALAAAEAHERKAEAEKRMADKAVEEATDAAAAADARVATLSARADELEKQLEELKRANKVTVIPEEGFRKKPAYVVLYSGGRELIVPGVISKRKYGKDGLDPNQFGIDVSVLDKHEYCIVLLVRPDAFEYMGAVAKVLRDKGFDVGRDPIGQNVELDFGGVNGK